MSFERLLLLCMKPGKEENNLLFTYRIRKLYNFASVSNYEKHDVVLWVEIANRAAAVCFPWQNWSIYGYTVRKFEELRVDVTFFIRSVFFRNSGI